MAASDRISSLRHGVSNRPQSSIFIASNRPRMHLPDSSSTQNRKIYCHRSLPKRVNHLIRQS
jgi:hypothetical protein